MSLKSLLMPHLTRRWLSRERLLAARERAERRRIARGARHEVHLFHQVDDPYSALLAQVLPEFVARYDVDLVPHLVGPPADDAAPDRERLVAYGRADAARLAHHFGWRFADPGRQPPARAVQRAQLRLLDAIAQGRFVEAAAEVSVRLWQGAGDETASTEGDMAALQAHLRGSEALRARLGHYLGATLYYEGEWTFGVDRLHHLERRLQELGAQRSGVTGVLVAPPPDLRQETALADAPPIDFFVSLRSPYSAIVTPRVFELARLTGAAVRLRYLLPMVMRGLPVPRAKRRYIALDAAREAHLHGTPFGCINDPLGRPTERGLALLAHAERVGKGQQLLRSFMQGVWAEGVDAGSDRGLARLAERAGLDWTDCRAALHDDGWRAVAEANRLELLELGLWGVPSFKVGSLAIWGQDRLWMVQQALLGGAAAAPPAIAEAA